MQFRPCIDIHNGQVKQIVGSSLRDAGNACENFVAGNDAAYYAKLYQRDGLTGGHIIILNKAGTPEYEATRQQALSALQAYPKGLQVGGGINCENAVDYLNAGASHVIVTSYVFANGQICYDHLRQLVDLVGAKHIVLDLSCRKMNGSYYIVTDRWQKFTETILTPELLKELSQYCDEYLIHAVDVEGMVNGIEDDVVGIAATSPIPITYAGGISSLADIERIKTLGNGRVNATVGSALSLFGGTLQYEEVIRCTQS